jgi:hypothetical protein
MEGPAPSKIGTAPHVQAATRRKTDFKREDSLAAAFDPSEAKGCVNGGGSSRVGGAARRDGQYAIHQCIGIRAGAAMVENAGAYGELTIYRCG